MSLLQKAIKIIFFRIYKLINLIAFTPFLLILIFLNFFKKVRIHRIHDFLGVFTDLNLYFCKKRMGLYRNFFDIFFINNFFKIFFLKNKISKKYIFLKKKNLCKRITINNLFLVLKV